MIMIIDTDDFTLHELATLSRTLTDAYESIPCEDQTCDNCDRYNACIVLKRLRDWANDKELWTRIEQEESWKQGGNQNV